MSKKSNGAPEVLHTWHIPLNGADNYPILPYMACDTSDSWGVLFGLSGPTHVTVVVVRLSAIMVPPPPTEIQLGLTAVGRYGVGYAYCSTLDNFSRKEGRRIAFARACRAAGRGESRFMAPYRGKAGQVAFRTSPPLWAALVPRGEDLVRPAYRG